jgi:hypothetical protein
MMGKKVHYGPIQVLRKEVDALEKFHARMRRKKPGIPAEGWNHFKSLVKAHEVNCRIALQMLWISGMSLITISYTEKSHGKK